MLELLELERFLNINLYTVPGQSIYTSTRRVVLEEVDGLVFVADSQRSRLYENVQAMREMKEHLRALGYRPQDVPLILQFNKRDLSYLSSVTTLQYRLAPSNNIPYFEAAATQGTGVIATLKQIVNLVLAKV